MRKYKQSEYSDNLLTLTFSGSEKTLDKLEKIYALIRPFVIDSLESFKPKTHIGRPSNNPEVLFKIFFIQKLQGESDRVVLENVMDRISYRRFLNITSEEEIPDRKQLVTFRKSFFKEGSPEKLFNKLFKMLRDENIIVKAGSMIDSKIIEAPGKKSCAKDRRDKYAKWTKKNEQSFFGYKMHINVDRDRKLIKSLKVTSANVHDSEVVGDILSKRTTDTIYADKGYASPVQEKILEQKGIRSNIMHKGYRNKPPSKYDEERNKRISKTRARVEHVFGRFVTEFRYVKTRYFEKYMNEMDMFFMAFLYNANVVT